VPENITKLRVVVTERCLTIGWSIAGVVYRQDIPMTVEETSQVTLRGGTARGYEIGKNPGCSSCGNGAIKNWRPWPGIVYRDAFRSQLAAAELKKDKNYGLPSASYTRTRTR
jgi:hypothetical protein